ncbi:MAG TPA: hypothetical protein VGE50_12275 [Gammaproteobacteria bacterium]
MKYLHTEELREAECASDAVKSSELLELRLGELKQILTDQQQTLGATERAKVLLDMGYILNDLDRKVEAWQLAQQAFELALPQASWTQAVEACDVMYQAEQPDSLKALVHGIWLGVTYPIDPELSVAMLHHLTEETPDNSDGGAVAAAVACYVVDMRAEGKQRSDLQFFTSQLLGQVARRHSQVDSQELFDFWVERMQLNDPALFIPRLGKILDVVVPAGEWWFDRDALRSKIPVE